MLPSQLPQVASTASLNRGGGAGGGGGGGGGLAYGSHQQSYASFDNNHNSTLGGTSSNTSSSLATSGAAGGGGANEKGVKISSLSARDRAKLLQYVAAFPTVLSMPGLEDGGSSGGNGNSSVSSSSQVRARYEILKILGAGASGTVLLVQPTERGAPLCTVKITNIGPVEVKSEEALVARTRSLSELHCLMQCSFFSILRVHQNFISSPPKVAMLGPNGRGLSRGGAADRSTMSLSTSRMSTASGASGAGGAGGGLASTNLYGSNANISIPRYNANDELIGLVVEFADSGDLRQEIKRRKRKSNPFREYEACLLFLQLLLGVHHMHSKRIIHRDIKSANVLIFSNGLVKIGDFGFAKKFVEDGVEDGFCGTPYYLAAEVWKQEPYGTKVDIFALGVLFYELLTLERPFSGATIDDVMDAIIAGEFEPLPKTLSTDVRRILRAMLDPNPKKRPSCRQLLRHQYFRMLMAAFKEIVTSSKLMSSSLKQTILSDLNATKIAITSAAGGGAGGGGANGAGNADGKPGPGTSIGGSSIGGGGGGHGSEGGGNGGPAGGGGSVNSRGQVNGDDLLSFGSNSANAPFGTTNAQVPALAAIGHSHSHGHGHGHGQHSHMSIATPVIGNNGQTASGSELPQSPASRVSGGSGGARSTGSRGTSGSGGGTHHHQHSPSQQPLATQQQPQAPPPPPTQSSSSSRRESQASQRASQSQQQQQQQQQQQPSVPHPPPTPPTVDSGSSRRSSQRQQQQQQNVSHGSGPLDDGGAARSSGGTQQQQQQVSSSSSGGGGVSGHPQLMSHLSGDFGSGHFSTPLLGAQNDNTGHLVDHPHIPVPPLVPNTVARIVAWGGVQKFNSEHESWKPRFLALVVVLSGPNSALRLEAASFLMGTTHEHTQAAISLINSPAALLKPSLVCPESLLGCIVSSKMSRFDSCMMVEDPNQKNVFALVGKHGSKVVFSCKTEAEARRWILSLSAWLQVKPNFVG